MIPPSQPRTARWFRSVLKFQVALNTPGPREYDIGSSFTARFGPGPGMIAAAIPHHRGTVRATYDYFRTPLRGHTDTHQTSSQGTNQHRPRRRIREQEHDCPMLMERSSSPSRPHAGYRSGECTHALYARECGGYRSVVIAGSMTASRELTVGGRIERLLKGEWPIAKR